MLNSLCSDLIHESTWVIAASKVGLSVANVDGLCLIPFALANVVSKVSRVFLKPDFSYAARLLASVLSVLNLVSISVRLLCMAAPGGWMGSGLNESLHLGIDVPQRFLIFGDADGVFFSDCGIVFELDFG